MTFAERWNGKGYEKGELQKFWIDLLVSVYGFTDIAGFINFEELVKLDHTSFIDGYIEATHVLIEQKNFDKDLRKGIRQSDGTFLTPFQQAKHYTLELTMPPELHKAHQANDFAVMNAYDFDKMIAESECVVKLMKMYQRLTSKK